MTGVNDLRTCACGCGAPINIDFFAVYDRWNQGWFVEQIAQALEYSEGFVYEQLHRSWGSLDRQSRIHAKAERVRNVPTEVLIQRSSLGRKKTAKPTAPIEVGKPGVSAYCSVGAHEKCSIPHLCRCDSPDCTH